jgi:FMN reductase
MHALTIAASPSGQSRSALLLDAARQSLARAGIAAGEVLVLRDLPAEPLLRGRGIDAALAAALERVQRADAVVLATPIYKAAYSGLLKVFLDLLPQDALHGKPAWPLACGGSPAHTLALDHSLRPVLDNLGAHPVLPAVFALESQLARTAEHAHAHDLADERGGPSSPVVRILDAALQRRLDAGAARLAQALDAQRAQALRERMRAEPARCSA